jgi:hypothetical protein
VHPPRRHRPSGAGQWGGVHARKSTPGVAAALFGTLRRRAVGDVNGVCVHCVDLDGWAGTGLGWQGWGGEGREQVWNGAGVGG